MVEKGTWTAEGSYQYAEQKDLRLIDDQLQKYFSDIYENAVKISETFETYRDLMGNLREAYQSSIANRANEIMRVFTAITTIFIPLTLITGIYGMNFDNMPELHWKYSYYVVLGIMVFAGALMFYLFRKKTGYEIPQNHRQNQDGSPCHEEIRPDFRLCGLACVCFSRLFPPEANPYQAQPLIQLLHSANVFYLSIPGLSFSIYPL